MLKKLKIRFAHNLFFFVAINSLISCYALPPSVPLPEVDDFSLDAARRQIVYGKTTEVDIHKLMGAPFAIRERSSKGVRYSSWYYPIRDTAHTWGSVIPAPVLKIFFNEYGIVSNWYFAHPVTDERMPVSESLKKADKLRERRCPPIPPRIELNKTIKVGITQKKDIESIFKHKYFRVYRFKEVRTNKVEVWLYYVDRPSPLLTHSNYMEISFTDGIVEMIGIQGITSAYGPLCK